MLHLFLTHYYTTGSTTLRVHSFFSHSHVIYNILIACFLIVDNYLSVFLYYEKVIFGVQSSGLNNDATYGMSREYMTLSNLYIVCRVNT